MPGFTALWGCHTSRMSVQGKACRVYMDEPDLSHLRQNG